MQIPLILTLEVRKCKVKFFWFNKIPQKKPVNEMEQEEQKNEYINAFDI